MKLKSFLMTVGVLAGFGGAHSALATVLFDTTSYAVGGYANIISVFEDAQGFTTGGSATTLNSVVLDIGDPQNTSGNFFVDLYSENSGVPDTLITALTGSANPTVGLNTYTGATALAANTTYFVVAGVSSGSGQYWWDEEDVNIAASSGLYLSADQGGSWIPLANGYAEMMQVNATLSPVPEPGAWAAVSAGLLGAVWLVKRRLAPVQS